MRSLRLKRLGSLAARLRVSAGSFVAARRAYATAAFTSAAVVSPCSRNRNHTRVRDTGHRRGVVCGCVCGCSKPTRAYPGASATVTLGAPTVVLIEQLLHPCFQVDNLGRILTRALSLCPKPRLLGHRQRDHRLVSQGPRPLDAHPLLQGTQVAMPRAVLGARRHRMRRHIVAAGVCMNASSATITCKYRRRRRWHYATKATTTRLVGVRGGQHTSPSDAVPQAQKCGTHTKLPQGAHAFCCWQRLGGQESRCD